MHSNPYSLLSGKTVLIVDDSYISNSIVKAMLEHNGVKVLMADSGEDALRVFLEEPEFSVNAILMDLSMPEMDGIETCTKIRNSGRLDSAIVPIIALTANSEDFYKQKCLESSMADFLTKPIDPNKLLHTLSLYLE